MKRWMKGLILVLLMTLCLAMVNTTLAEEKEDTEAKIKKTTEEITKKYKEAIVAVRIVLKVEVSVRGQSQPEQENTFEINGTAVDPSGLTIISYSYTNPEINTQRNPGVTIDFSVTSIKIVLNDGKELPASIVLKDEDLDIAFVRPDEKGLNLPCVKLVKTPAPKVLDEIVTISRLDFSTGRELVVEAGPIMAIITKPRTYYLGGLLMEEGLPAFNLKGECLGINLVRRGQSGGDRVPGAIFTRLATILPSEEITEVMKQVPPPKEKEKESEKGKEKEKGQDKGTE